MYRDTTMITQAELVLSLFALGIKVSKDTYAGMPAVAVDSGVPYHNVQICYLGENSILVRHKDIPGRDYVIKEDILKEFIVEEFDIASNCVDRCEAFDSFFDALDNAVHAETSADGNESYIYTHLGRVSSHA